MLVLFKDFFAKFPMEFSELTVIKSIHKALECAEKEYKKNKDGNKYEKYIIKAYHMMEAYFIEKGIDPNKP